MVYTISWNDVDGDWNTAGNWTPSGPPGPTDDVLIDTTDIRTVTFNSGSTTVNSLTVGIDSFALTGGSLDVTNRATFGGTVTISGGQLTMGPQSFVLGEFLDTAASSVSFSGDLFLNGGGSAPVYAFIFAPGASLDFWGTSAPAPVATEPSFTLTGGGTLGAADNSVLVYDATLDIAGDTVVAGNFDAEIATLNLGASELMVKGLFSYGGGAAIVYITGTGTLTFAGGSILSGATIGGSGSIVLQGTSLWDGFIYAYDGRVIENQGTLSLSYLDLGYGNFVGPTSSASLVNDTGATITFADSRLSEIFTLRTPTKFTNDGTVINTNNAPTEIGSGVALINNGVFQLQSGSVEIQGAMTGSGTVEIDAGASLSLDASAIVTPNAVNIASGTGTAHLIGGTADDVFAFGGNFTAADSVDGGPGNDTVVLNGDYTGVHALVMTATTLTNVETLTLTAGHSYDLTTDDATVAAGKVLTIDASALGAGDSLVFDGSAETNGGILIKAGAGPEILTGSSGNDGFLFGAAFTAADVVDGGAGTNDQIALHGDYSAGLTLGAGTISGIEVIACLAGFSYKLTTVDANVAAGSALTIWAIPLAAGNTLTFDGSAEHDGRFVVYGGAGNDSITGGDGADTFWGMGGADTLTGNGGANTFAYANVSESTGNTYDTIVGFNVSDVFDLPVHVTGVDAPIAAGSLAAASFDADLALAVNPANLAAHHAVVFTPQGADYAGHVFLVVDANGTAGYQVGADFVFDVTGASGLANLGSANFI